mgnify:CR=1 FL=1
MVYKSFEILLDFGTMKIRIHEDFLGIVDLLLLTKLTICIIDCKQAMVLILRQMKPLVKYAKIVYYLPTFNRFKNTLNVS